MTSNCRMIPGDPLLRGPSCFNRRHRGAGAEAGQHPWGAAVGQENKAGRLRPRAGGPACSPHVPSQGYFCCFSPPSLLLGQAVLSFLWAINTAQGMPCANGVCPSGSKRAGPRLLRCPAPHQCCCGSARPWGHADVTSAQHETCEIYLPDTWCRVLSCPLTAGCSLPPRRGSRIPVTARLRRFPDWFCSSTSQRQCVRTHPPPRHGHAPSHSVVSLLGRLLVPSVCASLMTGEPRFTCLLAIWISFLVTCLFYPFDR